jgi:hypothetical protein
LNLSHYSINWDYLIGVFHSCRETYGSQSPSILSDAWLAFQGPRTVSIGSTWQWKSENYSSSVSDDEALNAMEELLPKASAVYPGITKWKFVQARAGIRAMPPLTANGSLPLLGCLNDVIGKRSNCSFWLVGGLGARGLFCSMVWLESLLPRL